jgi:hypothetical protein
MTKIKNNLFLFAGIQYLLVVGGRRQRGELVTDVEVISLDTRPYVKGDVPNCLLELNSFPTTVLRGAGGVLGSGESKNGKKCSLVCQPNLLGLVIKCDFV